MTKGKPWSVEEEKQLKQMLQADKSVRVIAKAMGKTRDCIRKKIARLGLEVVVHVEKSGGTTTSPLALPEELPSVEEALKKLVAAMNALETPDLSKTEVLRLRSIIQAAGIYQAKVAEYIGYRELEAKIAKMEENYEQLLSEKTKDMASTKNNVAVSAARAS